MKLSELKRIGTYRTAPEAWGDLATIMINELDAVGTMAKCFGCDTSECDPDSYENDSPVMVELYTDQRGNYYVVYQGINEGKYQCCEDISSVGASGLLATKGSVELFLDED